jgi:uncharacterized protein (UPF0332 family)
VTPLQRQLLDRSAETVEAGRRAVADGDASTGANRAYYAMFYAAWALLADEPEIGRRHRSIHVAFGERFVKTHRLDAQLHRWLLDAFDLRLLADYDPMTTIEIDVVAETVEQAADFLASASALVAAESP